jgi:hypothetical protein
MATAATKPQPPPVKSSKVSAAVESQKKEDAEESKLGAGCRCLPDDWEYDGCALFWLAMFIITMVIFLAGFITPNWRENDEVTTSGLWRICAYDHCYDFVGNSRLKLSGGQLVQYIL